MFPKNVVTLPLKIESIFSQHVDSAHSDSYGHMSACPMKVCHLDAANLIS